MSLCVATTGSSQLPGYLSSFQASSSCCFLSLWGSTWLEETHPRCSPFGWIQSQLICNPIVRVYLLAFTVQAHSQGEGIIQGVVAKESWGPCQNSATTLYFLALDHLCPSQVQNRPTLQRFPRVSSHYSINSPEFHQLQPNLKSVPGGNEATGCNPLSIAGTQCLISPFVVTWNWGIYSVI